MGTDNLFHKRKAKDEKALKRRAPIRATYERILIVCEGEKTEPNYFTELVNHYKLSTANITVTGDCGSAPKSVVSYAVKLYNEARKVGNQYDRVYCVVDRDTHSCFDEAQRVVESFHPAETIFFIPSYPCFEYWLLCHFSYTRAAFMATGNRSAGENVLVALLNYWPEYEKGIDGSFDKLISSLEFAKANASRGISDAQSTRSENPSTSVHELVHYLQNIKVQ